MPSNSEMLDHISKLTNAIQQRRMEQQQPRYPQRPPPSSHPSYRYSGAAAGGRGSFTTGYPANSMNKSTYRPSAFPHNKSLVLNNTSQPSHSSPRPYATSPIPPRPRPQMFMNKTLNNASTITHQHSPATTPEIRSPTTTPHRSLVLNNNSNIILGDKRTRSKPIATSSLSSISQLPRQSQNMKLIIRHSKVPGTKSTSTSTYNNSDGQKIVVINGVPFINLGKKLVRQDTLNKATPATTKGGSGAPRVLIRKLVKRRDRSNNLVLRKPSLKPAKPIKRQRLDRKGNAVYIRKPDGYEQKGVNGNTLVLRTSSSSTTATKHQTTSNNKPTTYCGTFTRYGTCPKGTRCRFLHDPSHVAICVGYLMTKTCRNGSRCRLSHTPSPHNTPHCRHFQRMRCSNDPCPFAHVRVRPDAPLCRPFGVEGYCAKGSTCKNLHVIVCPTFAVVGKCTNQRCKFPHVASTAPTTAPTVKKNEHPTNSTSTTTTSNANKTTTTTSPSSSLTSASASKPLKKTQWIRPDLQATLDQQRKIKKQQQQQQQQQAMQAPLEQHHGKSADMDGNEDEDDGGTAAEEEDGFVPLFGDDDEDDDNDTEWNQYLIKNPEDVEEISSFRFSDTAADGNEDDDDEEEEGGDEKDDGMDEDGSEEEEEGIVYEEISDEDLVSDDSSVEEIYEEVSDDDDVGDVDGTM
ncbi:hypothetical protein BCR42DRAFT_42835 [Absidia repens]|uniref:C3H1-type domain-containing protein n=1 Tax=Absidia repens TaxID=90262 RepID=A0A1X2IFU2_9FUNG|nr:hypothetical protein BCR42DRAFT_42835 [Absidia repens]